MELTSVATPASNKSEKMEDTRVCHQRCCCRCFFVFLGANGKHHQKPPNFIGALVNLAKHEQDIDMTGLDMNRSYWDGNFNVWAW